MPTVRVVRAVPWAGGLEGRAAGRGGADGKASPPRATRMAATAARGGQQGRGWRGAGRGAVGQPVRLGREGAGGAYAGRAWRSAARLLYEIVCQFKQTA